MDAFFACFEELEDPRDDNARPPRRFLCVERDVPDGRSRNNLMVFRRLSAAFFLSQVQSTKPGQRRGTYPSSKPPIRQEKAQKRHWADFGECLLLVSRR